MIARFLGWTIHLSGVLMYSKINQSIIRFFFLHVNHNTELSQIVIQGLVLYHH